MSSIERNAEILSSFGLTIKQAKVYLALVLLGTAPVGEISKFSKVRREEVYRILPKLEKMGLIEKTMSVPVKLKATSVENALTILIRNEEENAKKRIAELTLKKAEFLDHFRTGAKEAKLGDAEQFSIISEKAVALSKIESLLDKAQVEIEYCVSREKILQFLKYFSEPLSQAVERGVKVRIISTPPHAEDEIPRAINQALASRKSVAIRYLESLPNHFLVIDSLEVLVATSTSGFLADNPLLWSNNFPHIMVYKKLFEELWDSSVESASLNVEGEDAKLQLFIKQMKPSSHVILLYETSDAKLKVLLNYIKYALENDEAVVYVCSEASVEEIKTAIASFGVDVRKYEGLGALKILDYTQHYIIDGRFDVERTLKLWNSYYEQATSRGFKGLRATGETACFFKHNLVKELVEYEKALHQKLETPMIAICAYRADMLMRAGNPVNIYAELVRAHGNVLFTWVDKELGRVAIS
ncbi:MAG: MEDS domain-containing protein [Candidatus Bathyarchaeota archaeon]|nr:MEDS domain-containing protein [Candidatus Bathyarchaeota archaeon]